MLRWLVLGFAVLALCASACRKAPALVGPRPTVALYAVDDESSVVRDVDEKRLPPSIAIADETVPVGPGRSLSVAYLRAPGPDEAPLRAAFGLVKLPSDRRLVIGPVDDGGPLRSYLIAGAPIFTERHVRDAAAQENAGQWEVLLTLDTDGARRLEDATRAYVNRRVALLVDDRVQMAPVVRSVIGGGKLVVTMGETTNTEARAKTLARRLTK